MKFKFIAPKDPEYDAECMLRWEVLGKPNGLPPGSEVVPEDKHSLHLIAMEGKQIVGCICFSAETQGAGQVFQMALSEDYRGRGFGRKLLHTLEQQLFKQGVRDVYVYAQQEVEGFYSKMGYHSEGESIKRNGAACRLMKKSIRHLA